MKPEMLLDLPVSLEVGREYDLLERGNNGCKPVLTPVRFVAYDPCPALVIVAHGGRRMRCPRDKLFEKDEGQAMDDTPRKLFPAVSCYKQSVKS